MGTSEEAKTGFTIIEVMIFLAISGLLFITVIGGTYAAIATQRYNDSVRSFAEFLRQTYSEVISPESLGATNGDFGGNSDQVAIYGKVAVFGLNNQTTIYTATLVGNTNVPSGNNDFMIDLRDVGARLFCGLEDASGNVINDTTVDTYTPLWQSQIHDASGNLLKGTLIIARSPTSGTVHTVYNPNFSPDLSADNGCRPNASEQVASKQFYDSIQDNVSRDEYKKVDVNFCIKSDQSNIIREVQLTADGHNNTAINLVDGEKGICR